MKLAKIPKVALFDVPGIGPIYVLKEKDGTTVYYWACDIHTRSPRFHRFHPTKEYLRNERQVPLAHVPSDRRAAFAGFIEGRRKAAHIK